MLMFNSFPREVGAPRKMVYNVKDLLEFINIYNGKKSALYTSLYAFNDIPGKRPNYESATVDKLFFDFDDKECDSWGECNKLHQECVKEKLLHCIVMSGRGYHLYIFTEEYEGDNAKAVIYNSQMYFVSKLKLKADRQVIGNPAQLCRIPNTYNIKGGKYCIPLRESEFERGDIFCKGFAISQNIIKNTAVIGEKKLELKQFDMPSKKQEENNDPISDDISSTNIVMRGTPLCIEVLLKKKDLSYKERYLVILYFREIGYTKKEILGILKDHLSDRKFKHCIIEERQLQYLFSRVDLMFPNCEKIRKDGFCVDGCKITKKHNIYK